jgi:hypothetical protein
MYGEIDPTLHDESTVQHMREVLEELDRDD